MAASFFKSEAWGR